MQFVDNIATCSTSPVSKRTLSIVLQTHTQHYIHTTFPKLLLSFVVVHLRKRTVAFETCCVFNVFCVFFKTTNKIIYWLVMSKQTVQKNRLASPHISHILKYDGALRFYSQLAEFSGKICKVILVSNRRSRTGQRTKHCYKSQTLHTTGLWPGIYLSH